MDAPRLTCSPALQDQTRAFERLLGHWLPFCSGITATSDGGLIATPLDANGRPASSLRLEFDPDGTVRFSESDSSFRTSHGIFFAHVELARIEGSAVRAARGLLLFSEELQRMTPGAKRHLGLRE